MTDVFQIAAKNLGRKFGKMRGGAKPLEPTNSAPQGAKPLPTTNPYDDWTSDELEAEIVRRGAGSPSIPVIQRILAQRRGKSWAKPVAGAAAGAATLGATMRERERR